MTSLFVEFFFNIVLCFLNWFMHQFFLVFPFFTSLFFLSLFLSFFLSFFLFKSHWYNSHKDHIKFNDKILGTAIMYVCPTQQMIFKMRILSHLFFLLYVVTKDYSRTKESILRFILFSPLSSLLLSSHSPHHNITPLSHFFSTSPLSTSFLSPSFYLFS